MASPKYSLIHIDHKPQNLNKNVLISEVANFPLYEFEKRHELIWATISQGNFKSASLDEFFDKSADYFGIVLFQSFI